MAENNNNGLIFYLIQYSKTFKQPFPFETVKYIDNNIIIERIENCIENSKIYDCRLFKSDEFHIMDDSNLKKVIPLIRQTFNDIGFNYKEYQEEIKDIINERNSGKSFSFNEHLKALIMCLLNNHRWGNCNIKEHQQEIDNIFHNYDKNYLKNVNPCLLIKEIRNIHCSNVMIQKQMESLSYNISILERIKKDYKSLDNYVTTTDPNVIANDFCEGKYKLKQVGKALALDYLKYVGINNCKSSKLTRRLFGNTRLGVVDKEKASNGQVITIIKKLAVLNRMSEFEVEFMLQQFCLQHSSNICGDNPKCNICKLNYLCKYTGMSNL